MNLEYLQSLYHLGFSKNLATVYLFVLENDDTNAGSIIKATKLQRSVVYSSLSELVERGLVEKIERKGVAVFSVNDTEAIVREIENKEVAARNLAKELERDKERKERTATVIEGSDIIQRISDKTLKIPRGETIYFLAPSKYGHQAKLESYWQKYHKKRIVAGIHCKILYDRNTNKSIVENRNNMDLCQAKYLPFGSDEPTWYIVAENLVALIVPSEEPPLAFLITSKHTAKAIVNSFNYLWKQ